MMVMLYAQDNSGKVVIDTGGINGRNAMTKKKYKLPKTYIKGWYLGNTYLYKSNTERVKISSDDWRLIYHSKPHLEKVNQAISLSDYLVKDVFHNQKIQTADDLFCSSHSPMYANDQEFANIITTKIENIGVPRTIYNLHRIYFCLRMSIQALKLNPQGIFIECGVGSGMTSLTMLEYYKSKNLLTPKFFLFDTFEGMPNSLDNIPYLGGSFSENQIRFESFPEVSLIKGILPDTLSTLNLRGDKISFAHIDLNNGDYESEVLAYILPLMTSPGIIVLDDYNYVEFENSKRIIDQTCNSLNILKPIGMPFGSAFMIV
jgi:hypothetical protein